MLKKHIPFLSAVLLLAAAYGCKDSDTSSGQVKGGASMAIDVWLATPMEINNEILANGTLLANEEIELRNEVPGRVETLAFKEGQFVKAGQMLLKIDDAVLQAQYQKLKTQLELAKKDEIRKKGLLEIKGISQEIYDAAAAQVAELESEVSLTQSQIRNSKILAPFSGRVGLRYISPGAYLSQGDRIATLVQDNPLKVEFSVPQRFAGKIEIGQAISFKHSGANQPDTALVYAKEPRIDIATRTLKVRGRVDNQDGKLIPGSYVEVRLNLETIPDAIMVPTEIIIPQLRGEKVFLIKNGKAIAVEVETGIRTETHVQLVRGVAPGDTIASTALLALKDGMAVSARKVVNATQQP
jgi:membrane fusion protein (multidrug efflux system)